MKTVKSLFKVTVALILAFALMTLTACDVINGLFNKGGDDNATNGDGKEYTVTFIADGGTLSEELTKYTSGTAKQLPDAEKAHYTFGGWYADDSLSGNPVTSISEKEKGNKTYYAKWTPETYSVEFTIKNDTAYQADLNSYTYNRAVSLPAPTKSGSTFNGWYEKEDLSGNIVTSISAGQYGAKHYYGEWLSGNVEIYNVNLVLNGGTLKGSNITSYVKGKGATLPDIEKTNYTFEGWYTNRKST